MGSRQLPARKPVLVFLPRYFMHVCIIGLIVLQRGPVGEFVVGLEVVRLIIGNGGRHDVSTLMSFESQTTRNK